MTASIVDQANAKPELPGASNTDVPQSGTASGALPTPMLRPVVSETQRLYRLLCACKAATVVYMLIVVVRLLNWSAVPCQESAGCVYQAQHLEYYVRVDSTLNGVAYHGPGFAILVRASILLVHDPFMAAKAVTALIVLGYLAIAWRLLHVWFAPGVARIAYLLGLSLLPLLETLALPSGDAGAGLLVMTGLLILQAKPGERKKERTALLLAFAAGLLFGGAYLFRYLYKLLPLVVIGTWLLFEPGHIWEKAKRCAALLVGFGLVFAAWAVCCKWGRGEWFPDRSHAIAAWQALDAGRSPIHLSDYADKYPTVAAMFRYQGAALLRAWGNTLYHAPTDFVLGTFALCGLLMPLGLFLYLRQLNFARLQFLTVAVVLIAAAAFFRLDTRTLLPLMFWLLGLCSLGMQSEFVPMRLDDLYEDGSWLWRGLARAYLRPVVMAAMFAGLLIPLLRARPWSGQPSALDLETTRAGQALHAIAKRSETLAASVYSIGQTADVHTISLHQLLPHDAQFTDNLMLRVLATHANYLAYVEGPSNAEYPGLSFLLTPGDPQIPANFELVYQNDAHPRVVIYRVHWWIWVQQRQAAEKAKNRKPRASNPRSKEADLEWR